MSIWPLSICHNLSMCGRYRLSWRKQILEEYFDSADWQEDWNPRFNIAPTQPVPVIRQNPKKAVRETTLMRWGLIPSWAKDSSAAAQMINARSETAKTCSILTTIPNVVTSAVRDRMPVILDPDAYDVWLDPGMKDVRDASELLKPYDARLMRCYPVSTRINHVANDDEECSRSIENVEVQNRLFS